MCFSSFKFTASSPTFHSLGCPPAAFAFEAVLVARGSAGAVWEALLSYETVRRMKTWHLNVFTRKVSKISSSGAFLMDLPFTTTGRAR
jgi:hypothetical protein